MHTRPSDNTQQSGRWIRRLSRWFGATALALALGAAAAPSQLPSTSDTPDLPATYADQSARPDSWEYPPQTELKDTSAESLPTSAAESHHLQEIDQQVAGIVPSEHGIPANVLQAYVRAAQRLSQSDTGCHLDWSLLAGIGKIESNHARNGSVDAHGNTSPHILGPVLNGAGFVAVKDTDHGVLDGDSQWDRAIGMMQFIPGTWAVYGADGNLDGNPDPHNIFDSALAAAQYLCAGPLDLSETAGQGTAVFGTTTRRATSMLLWHGRFSTETEQTRSPSAGRPQW